MGDSQLSDTTREFDPKVDGLLFTLKSAPQASPAVEIPQCIGRYRVERLLGRGGFGVVYLANDGLLSRLVAIKVPHRKIIDEAEVAEIYLNEARIVAGLDHPHIVPVYDVGCSDMFPFFVVSKYIDGTDLASRLKQRPFSIPEAVRLAATVADALHYAHNRGLVHRDIKPGNLLLDKTGKPFVADFGMALRDEQFGAEKDQICGTSHYMSPEQARGESHLVDGRADIFSLGVVLYELLTGARPFPGTTVEEVLRAVMIHEPRPLRQRNELVPRELDRILMHALAKRSSDRYSTAKDFAADLQHFLESHEPVQAAQIPEKGSLPEQHTAESLRDSAVAYSHSKSLVVVPKGLQAFDESDVDFFLGLVPGPHDRDGLPRCLKFWKSRITATSNPLRIGVVYGPSGCGKSSLIRAGLLPKLPDSLVAIVITATAQSTERQLMEELKTRFPELPARLPDALKRLRQHSPGNRQVLIVIDQFEQWLHANRSSVDAELVQALRQCDGEHVGCLLIVRDDFWMSVHRFFGELDVRLAEQDNCAAVDLFDTRHARRVLQAFGHAYGALPERTETLTSGQQEFLDRAIAELAEDDRVICVRLALFAQMVRNRPWVPATLNAIGGARGVGIRFLEDTFGSSSAPLSHRVHQGAIVSILKALLPPPGTEIKACTRTASELARIAQYDVSSNEFQRVLEILQEETRLLTPVDASPLNGHGPIEREEGAECGYQLTHDYLVPSIREWLSRKQQDSWRGRCEKRLEERVAFWSARPERRQLPTFWETAQISLGTRSSNWTALQSQMMRKAQLWHGSRVLLFGLTAVVALAIGTIWHQKSQHALRQHAADELVDRLMVAEIGHVTPILTELESTRDIWPDRLGKTTVDDSTAAEKLRAELALVARDPARIATVLKLSLDADDNTIEVVRDWLTRYAFPKSDQLWSPAEVANQPASSQLRIAALLAAFAPNSEEHWQVLTDPVAHVLVSEVSLDAVSWADLLQPVRTRLAASLAKLLSSGLATSGQRLTAVELLSKFGSTELLCRLVPDADASQLSIFIRPLSRDRELSVELLSPILDSHSPVEPLENHLRQVGRQRTACVALMLLGRDDLVWPHLSGTSDLTLRTELMLTMRNFGVPFETLLFGEKTVADPFARQAIWQSFASDEGEIPQPEKAELARRIQRRWPLATHQSERAGIAWLAKRCDLSHLLVAGDQLTPPAGRDWSVNSQGQTFLHVTGPVEFMMGSPETDPRRDRNELQHPRRIDRSFAISVHEVTVEQFRRFRPDYQPDTQVVPTSDCPAISVSWLDVAKYCRWLSLQEGLPADQVCYPPDDQINSELEFPPDLLLRKGYRLPTEAEWEYVCRGGSSNRYLFGEDEQYTSDFGWWIGNSHERTWAVGLKRPNRFGVFDMQGNVLEWCQDSWEDYPVGTTGAAISQTPAELRGLSGTARVLRSATYRTANRSFRCAHRSGYGAHVEYSTLGFRLVRTISAD